VRRVTVAVVGGALALMGVALLVLPGPGFVLVAAGLTVLATQFTWAARPLAYARGRAVAGLEQVGRSKRRAFPVVLAGLFLLAVGIAEVTVADLPLVSILSAVMLIISGVTLLATVVHARTTPRYRRPRLHVRRSGGGATRVDPSHSAGDPGRTDRGRGAGPGPSADPCT
jgi:hypothetical protein